MPDSNVLPFDLIRAKSCSCCKGLGYFWAERIGSPGSQYAFACACPAGDQRKSFLRWSRRLEEFYKPEWGNE
jgi:hypothetical protein